MVLEQLKNIKLNYYVRLADTLLMNSGYDEELTTLAGSMSHFVQKTLEHFILLSLVY